MVHKPLTTRVSLPCGHCREATARTADSAPGHAARLLLVAKRLERIGDYVTDICEQIVYMKEATVIKHRRLNN